MLIWGTPSIGETVKQLDSHTPWGHKSSTWGKLCRAYLWKSSPGSPGHHVPLLLYTQHTRGHTDLLLPLQVHKMRAWRTSAPSLGPSLLQRKIHPPPPPGAVASHVWPALSTCPLSTLSQGKSTRDSLAPGDSGHLETFLVGSTREAGCCDIQ